MATSLTIMLTNYNSSVLIFTLKCCRSVLSSRRDGPGFQFTTRWPSITYMNSLCRPILKKEPENDADAYPMTHHEPDGLYNMG